MSNFGDLEGRLKEIEEKQRNMDSTIESILERLDTLEMTSH